MPSGARGYRRYWRLAMPPRLSLARARRPVRDRRRRRPDRRRRPRPGGHDRLPRRRDPVHLGERAVVPDPRRAGDRVDRRAAPAPRRRRVPDSTPRTGIAAIAAVLAIYAVTALVHDQPEEPGDRPRSITLAVLVACWLGGGTPAIVCGARRGDRRPARRDRDRRARARRVRAVRPTRCSASRSGSRRSTSRSASWPRGCAELAGRAARLGRARATNPAIELARVDARRGPDQRHVELVGDLDRELAAVELDRDRARARRRGRRRPRRRWRRCPRRASPPPRARRSAPGRSSRRRG